jgi:hypothetical protein
VIARQDKDGFPGLRAALQFLGGPKAEMQSHLTVFYEFLALLWPPDEVSTSLWYRPFPAIRR